MKFSLFFFSADGSATTSNRYQFLLDTVRFGDSSGFAAAWVPERHFQDFGGLYPNPAVVAAAMAMQTSRIEIRAGSVVLPLHHPLRVAEEWSVIDNLSGGRVGLSFATGWHPTDFVLAPDRFADRKEHMFNGIEVIRALWRGESLQLPGPGGQLIDVQIYPKPLRSTLPIWITTSGSRNTWIRAGEVGTNVLGSLIGQSLADVAENIKLYQDARRRYGHPPGEVSLMLHTFLGMDEAAIKTQVRRPLQDYLRNYIQQQRNAGAHRHDLPDIEDLVEFAFERYYSGHALLGTPQKCERLLERLDSMGVNEVACLIDFGPDVSSTIRSLELVNQLRARFNKSSVSVGGQHG